MKILTKQILKKLPNLYETDGKKDTKVHLKLFNPTGAGTWYITEYDPETGDAFGFINMGNSNFAELGYVNLIELLKFKGRFGLGIERDKSFESTLLSEVIETVKSGGHV